MSTPALALSRPSVLDSIAVILSKLDEIGRDLEIKLTDAGSFKRDRLESVLQINQAQRSELAAFLDKHGCESSKPAPQVSLVDEGIARIRALFSELDVNMLPDIAEDQRLLLSTYDDALEVMMASGRASEDLESLQSLMRTHRAQLEEIIASLNTAQNGVPDQAAHEARA